MVTRIKESQEKFMQFYQDFKESREKEDDNYKLARSRSEKLDKLIKSVETEFNIIDKRVQSGKTHCVVFDSKKYSSDTIPCALINENISGKLDSTQEYYLKGVENAKSVTVDSKLDQKSNKIPQILVPTVKWEPLKEVRLTLSPSHYSTFMKECQAKPYIMDAIIVAVNSVDDFKDDDIKLLLKEMMDNRLQPFVFLNDAPETECTQIDDCDECYEDSRDFLKPLHFLSEDRFVKVSAKGIIDRTFGRMELTEKFEKVKALIKNELTMESVVERFLKKATMLMTNLADIEKTVLEDTSKIMNETQNYENKLKEKNTETDGTINDSQHQIVMELENKIMDSPNAVTLNEEYLRNNVEPIIDKNFETFRNTFGKQIIKLLQAENPKFEKYIANMYFEGYLNKNDYEVKLKLEIDQCLKEIMEELQNVPVENNDNQSKFERFFSQAKNLVVDTYRAVASSFTRFVEQFKDKILEKYEKFAMSIKNAKDDFIGCLRADLKGEINNALSLIKRNIDNKKRSLRPSINNTINSIIDVIKSKSGVNIHPGDITNYLPSSSNSANKLSLIIEIELKQLKEEIIDAIASIGTNDSAKIWTRELSEYYRDNYFQNFVQFKSTAVTNINNLYNDLMRDNYYKIEVKETSNDITTHGVRVNNDKVRDGIIGGVISGATVGAVGGTVALPVIGTIIGATTGALYGGLIGLFGGTIAGTERTTEVKSIPPNITHYKYIKEDEMKKAVKEAEETLDSEMEEMVDDILNDFDRFIKAKSL